MKFAIHILPTNPRKFSLKRGLVNGYFIVKWLCYIYRQLECHFKVEKVTQNQLNWAGLSIGGNTKEEGKRRDSRRIEQAKKRVQDQHEKYRLARSQARKRDEEQRISQEGVSYEAGGFNEVESCNMPRRKKETENELNVQIFQCEYANFNQLFEQQCK